MDPTVDDLQRGGKDPKGFPWGNARQLLFQKNGIQNIPFSILGLPIQGLTIRNQQMSGGAVVYQELWKVDPEGNVPDIFVCVDTNLNGVCDLEDDIKIKAIDQDGNCKTPTLRNTGLNGPYFHNGGALMDYGNGIAVDSGENVYVAGYTVSSNFPTRSPYKPTLSGSGAAFITKLRVADITPVYLLLLLDE